VHDVVAERDELLASHANTPDRDAVHDGPRVGDLREDRTVRGVRFRRDAHGALTGGERRDDRTESIAIVVRDRHDDARVNAIHHRARDVAHEIAVADAGRATGAVNDDRIARVLEDECD
jgi:hypothetical protein